MITCVICEAEHENSEIELVTGGVENGVIWKRFRCLRNGEEWENWTASSPDYGYWIRASIHTKSGKPILFLEVKTRE